VQHEGPEWACTCGRVTSEVIQSDLAGPSAGRHQALHLTLAVALTGILCRAQQQQQQQHRQPCFPGARYAAESKTAAQQAAARAAAAVVALALQGSLAVGATQALEQQTHHLCPTQPVRPSTEAPGSMLLPMHTKQELCLKCPLFTLLCNSIAGICALPSLLFQWHIDLQ